MTTKLSLPRFVTAVLALMFIWAILVTFAPLTDLGGMKVDGTGSDVFAKAAREVAEDHRGNLALVLIENGKVAQSHTMSIGKPVSGDSMFQMASVSKWVTAWGVMALVEAGKVDLDAPVSRYVKRWTLPRGDYPNERVTVRRLLSHTAGLTDDLGYCGFPPGAKLQPIEDSLSHAADACPLRTGAVRVGKEHGSWRYSGGGYTLLQLMIEEVSGEPFADYMDRTVLDPLGMENSTFRTSTAGAADVAEFFGADGGVAPHYRYTAAAAASLYSSANDMARFAQAHMPGPDGEVPGRGVISPGSLASLRAPEADLFGSAHWGLGVQLFARSTRGDLIFGHNGGNVPAVNNTVRIEAATGDAIVALSTGGRGIATRLGGAWTAQRRAAITPAMIYGTALRLTSPAEALMPLLWIVGGWATILAGSFRLRRRDRSRHPCAS
ncbi:serine hydrolase domain-containing protein [Porphyrobacter sp. YT40]|uniref:serine hydrolase domain-containing protein n=1 Tax=Porphyrobacter sp. YT40 TaxID=2547601 RepID=UPI00114258A7|nr:serine hydrolase domain-containing protein [Porphyrobacter sp. YT40]QDH36434.1 beta-lactamase family protein [Porphyrobacter sp. YT40]